MTILEAIKKAREAKGYSLQTLAKKSGINASTINKWETRGSFPTIINLIPVADALGISLDELVGRVKR